VSAGAITRNVQIPLTLFLRIIELLEYIDVSQYDQCIQDDYLVVKNALNLKFKKLGLRVTYSKMLDSTDVLKRHDALIDYLIDKKELYGYPPLHK
jgi:hypothetical protein